MVVVTDAMAQKPFWLHDRSWGDPNIGGWDSFTATNFHVVRVIKGQATPWLQRQQQGATPNSLPCPHHIEVIANQPPPTVGTQYLLFDYHHLRLNPNRPQQDQGYQGAWWRFPVINGIVHSETELNPQAETMQMTPQPLDAFLRSIGL
jgi:hypothetical protein